MKITIKKRLGVLATISFIAWILIAITANVMAQKGEQAEEIWVRLYESSSGFAATLEKGMDVDGDGNIFRQGYEKFEEYKQH